MKIADKVRQWGLQVGQTGESKPGTIGAPAPSDTFSTGSGQFSRTAVAVTQGFSRLVKATFGTPVRTAVVTGLLLLTPPTVGLVRNYADEPARPVFTYELDEAQRIGGPETMKRNIEKLKPSAMQESSLREMIRLYVEAEGPQSKLDSLIRECNESLSKMSKGVPWDAKVGETFDSYWFGVSNASKPFHQGTNERDSLQEQKMHWVSTHAEIKATIRDSLSSYLRANNPVFAKNEQSLVQNQKVLNLINEVVQASSDTLDKLKDAIDARSLADRTPQEAWVKKKIKDRAGNETEVEVYEANPEYKKRDEDADDLYDDAKDALNGFNAKIEELSKTDPNIPLKRVRDISGFPGNSLAGAQRDVTALSGTVHSAQSRYQSLVNGLQRQVDDAIHRLWEALKPPGSNNPISPGTVKADRADW